MKGWDEMGTYLGSSADGESTKGRYNSEEAHDGQTRVR